jgi:hypothetical protein
MYAEEGIEARYWESVTAALGQRWAGPREEVRVPREQAITNTCASTCEGGERGSGVARRGKRIIREYSVYYLVDPRDGEPFYVGMSGLPRQRAGQHRTDPASAGYHRVREIHASGMKCLLRVVARFPTRLEARRHEDELIAGARVGSLLNRIAPCRERGDGVRAG